MPKFSKRSKDRLVGCHPNLQLVCNQAIRGFDFTILEGHRNEMRQAVLYSQGMTRVTWPNSKHNKTPSMAVDVAPWPIDWGNTERFYLLAGMLFAIAQSKDIKLRWGGDWDKDWQFSGQNFNDLPHFELIVS